MAKTDLEEIRIIMLRRDGSEAVVDLRPPISLRTGSHLNVLTDGTGTDYYFNFDGHYDGWGKGLYESCR